MERELRPPRYRGLRATAKDFSQKYVHIPAWVLIAVSPWAALRDRPVCRACDQRDRSTTSLRPLRLPSPSTMSRRAYSVGVGLLRRALGQRLRTLQEPALAAFLDGKPLPVGGYGKGPDAGHGSGAGHTAKGYELHAVWANRCLPEPWEVAPPGVREKAVAGQLPPRLGHGGGLPADGNDDGSDPFDPAHQAGCRPLVPAAGAGRPRRGGQGPPLPEPAQAALHRDDAAGPGQVGLRAGAVPKAGGHREEFRQRRGLRRRPGAAAGVGAATAPCSHLGLGRTPHQRR